MIDDLQTDEYRISISREMTVCRNMIERQKKHLVRFEREYGITTEEMLNNQGPKVVAKARDIDDWRNEYEGLVAWRQRLNDYEKAYEELKR